MSYQKTDILQVYTHHLDEKIKVGRLAYKDRRILFEYTPDFIAKGIELSPFKLPLKQGVQLCDEMMFDGLFGLFNDSLPDGWGRLLLDRTVEAHGINRGQLTPLDRLAYVGQNGMGALSYEPDLNETVTDTTAVSLDKIAHEAHLVLEGEGEIVIEELRQLNGSSGGARPKIVAQVSTDKKALIHGKDTLEDGFEHWMIKFSSSADPADIGAIEYAYGLMAKAAGLDMPDIHLFLQTGGAGYFGVKRFDRQGAQRVHMHSLCGLIHADHRTPSLDYKTVLKVTQVLTKNMAEVEKAFRLACFNVFAHNRDDHSKNFSFILNSLNEWQLSPAYDLTYSFGPAGEHSTMVMGEGLSPGLEHLKALASELGIRKTIAEDVLQQVLSAVHNWNTFAGEAGVSKRSQKTIAAAIAKQLK